MSQQAPEAESRSNAGKPSQQHPQEKPSRGSRLIRKHQHRGEEPDKKQHEKTDRLGEQVSTVHGDKFITDKRPGLQTHVSAATSSSNSKPWTPKTPNPKQELPAPQNPTQEPPQPAKQRQRRGEEVALDREEPQPRTRHPQQLPREGPPNKLAGSIIRKPCWVAIRHRLQ